MNKKIDKTDVAFVTIEFPDGQVLSGRVDIAEVSFTTETILDRSFSEAWPLQVPELVTWDISLQGYGPLEMRKQYRERIEQQRAAPEWRCPYCGQVHPRARRKCWDGINGCGAPRPLALDENKK